MSKTIKFGVIGFGHIGKRHAAMISANPEAELVAVCDIDPSQSELAEKEYNVPFFSNEDEFFSSQIEMDVICICTPNGHHSEHAIKAIEKGAHPVVEKPMGLRKADCEKVIYNALQNSRQVFCVMQNRYSPPSVWLKSVVDSDLLGSIYMVQINCFWNRGDNYYAKSDWKGSLELDGGPLFTQFSHFMDIMFWLFGDIDNISATFENFNHEHNTEFEDSGFVNFKFLSGGLGAFNYSTSVDNKNLESSMTIVAEKGTIKVGGQYMDKVEYCNIQNYKMPELPPVNPPNDYGDYKGSAANHHYIIDNVVNTLLQRDKITTNALEGLKVVEIIERIYALRSEKSDLSSVRIPPQKVSR
ncbi:MAG: Gfo/Idh/MocA family oxidoreductase [Chitinophagales bacterium]|nr:Gfo/Idh/MocA family oxidoreductase [Chitinophagales bacterium]